jgi:hypothetical protein
MGKIQFYRLQEGDDTTFHPQNHAQKSVLFIPKSILIPGRDKLSQKWSLESEPLWEWSC